METVVWRAFGCSQFVLFSGEQNSERSCVCVCIYMYCCGTYEIKQAVHRVWVAIFQKNTQAFLFRVNLHLDSRTVTFHCFNVRTGE